MLHIHMRLLPSPAAPAGGAQLLWPVATPSVCSSVAQYARYPECANAPPLRTRRATWHSSALAKRSVVRLGLFDVLLPLLLVVVLLVPRLLGRRRHPLLDRLEGRLPLARSLRLLLREERQLRARGGGGSRGKEAAWRPWQRGRSGGSLSQVLKRWPRDGPARACLARASGGVLEGSRRGSGGGLVTCMSHLFSNRSPITCARRAGVAGVAALAGVAVRAVAVREGSEGRW